MTPATPQREIVTLTLNPALDLSTALDRVEAGPKLRCDAPQVNPGGGGINVARAIGALGGHATAMVALGGETGDRVARLVRGSGLALHPLPCPGETRESFAVLETTSGRQFRFVLPGPVWGPGDVQALLAEVTTANPNGFCVISGSQPPGVPADFAARLVALLPVAQMVLDTSGAALAQAVAQPAPGLAVLRMDSEEAEGLTGHPLTTRRDSADYAQALVRAGVASCVIIARGADGSVLAEADLRLFCPAARVPVVSKVGAGDSFVGAYVLARARGEGQAEALSHGVAAASAAVMTEATELCRAEDVARLLPECRAEPV